jgi:hypothetical protein
MTSAQRVRGECAGTASSKANARETTVVTYSPGDRNDLQPGVKIFIAAATKQADGTLLTSRVNYGKDGITPPM